MESRLTPDSEVSKKRMILAALFLLDREALFSRIVVIERLYSTKKRLAKLRNRRVITELSSHHQFSETFGDKTFDKGYLAICNVIGKL